MLKVRQFGSIRTPMPVLCRQNVFYQIEYQYSNQVKNLDI